MLQPKVSIIIVNYNGRILLQKCLESISKIDYNNYEIIIVDNNSSDDTIDFITKNHPSIILIKLNENKGFAEPNNIGAKIATGDYLLFLNNDTIVNTDFISKMIQVIQEDKKIAICQSLLLKPDGKIDSSGDFIDKLGVVHNSKTKIDQLREISSARGASMLVRKQIFQELNGFDEKFFATFEDVDLGWRAWILGYRVVLVPNSIVVHTGGMAVQNLRSKIAFHGFKNQLVMKITNFEPSLAIKNMFLFFLIYGTRELKIWLDYTFKGKTRLTPTKYEDTIAKKPSLQIIFKSICWVLKNQNYIMKKQKKVNSMRVLSTGELKKKLIISE